MQSVFDDGLELDATSRDVEVKFSASLPWAARVEAVTKADNDEPVAIEGLRVDPSVTKITIDEEKILTAIVTPDNADATISRCYGLSVRPVKE